MLTHGAIQQMVNGNTNIRPRLQILDVKKIVTGQQGERCRLVLSDGEFYIQGMLASQCTQMMANGQLNKFAVIHLQEFVCNTVSNKKICVVIKCDVVQQQNAAIGSPKNVITQPQGNTFANQGNANNRPAPPQNQQAFHQRNPNQGYGGNNNQNNQNRFGGNNQGNGNNNNNRRGGGGGNNDRSIQPVSSLNPYQSAWKIKVRVTKKDTMRHYHNQKGDGKLFGLDFLDAEGTEIRAVCFNDTADKFYGIFEKDKVYTISRGSVRLAKKGYSHITNDYSITLNNDSEVTLVEDSGNEIMGQKYKFVSIADIESVEPKAFVDVIGVVVDVGPLSKIMSNRTQKEIIKRELKIADRSAKVNITLWSEDAENFNEEKVGPNTVVAFKGAKVSDFGGRSLSASGLIDVNPDLQEAMELCKWVQASGGNVASMEIRTLTQGRDAVSANAPRRTFAEVKDMKLGEHDDNNSMDGGKKKADYFTVVGTITTISHSQDKKPWYEANPDLNCATAKNAKVQSMGDGTWRCEKNGKVYNSYIPRYILRWCTTDFSGNIWMTSFNEVAEKILGRTAVEAEKMLQTDPEAYDRMFKEATFKKYVFKCKAFSDFYEDSARVRYDCIGVQLADAEQESEKLLEKIQMIQTTKAGAQQQAY
jgi:replication factor A1